MKPKLYANYIFLLLISSFNYSQDAPFPIEGIAAVVGENIILKSEVTQLAVMTAMQKRVDVMSSPEKLAKFESDALTSLIDQKIILEEAKLDSIEVDDKNVDQSLDMYIENMISQAGGEKKVEEYLGQTIKQYRRDNWYEMRDRLISDQYQNSLLSSIAITRSDVESFYSTYRDSLPLLPTKVKLRHLLIQISASLENQNITIATLDSLYLLLEAGADFGELAKIYSQDPGSKTRGGDLGFSKRGSLVKEFELVAFTQEEGELSHPVKTSFGYHLIKTLEKKGDLVRIQHILITPGITIEDESRAYNYAMSIRDSISSLSDFEHMVEKESQDEKTRSIGGDLGWADPANLPIPEIAQVISYLKKNECSLPVQTSFGYHLLWLENIKPGGKPDLEHHWAFIEEMALNYKKMNWYKKWITEARKNTFVSLTNK